MSNPRSYGRGRASVHLRWALACAIIVLRGPLGNRAHMLCLCVVSGAVAVTCMQRHEHRSTMCGKLVADCKIRICVVRWARRQFVRQAGKEEGRMVCCCVQTFAGNRLEISLSPPSLGSAVVRSSFVGFCLFVHFWFAFCWVLRLRVGSTIIVFGWGQSGWRRHVKGGLRLPLPPFGPLHF